MQLCKHVELSQHWHYMEFGCVVIDLLKFIRKMFTKTVKKLIVFSFNRLLQMKCILCNNHLAMLTQWTRGFLMFTIALICKFL